MRNLKKHWWKAALLLIGIGLRLFLAGITVHPDLLSISAGDFLLAKKGIINIYEYLAQAPPEERLIEVYGRFFFTYPPLAYFALGLFNFLLSPFFSSGIYTKVLGGIEVFGGLGFDKDLLLLKLPYLVFDLFCALVLFKVFEKDKRKAWLASLLWFFNPLSFYTSFLIGQFDVIPTLLVVLSAFWAIRERKELAALSLGIGASLKIFPLFFLPVLVCVSGKSFWQRLKLGVIGLLPCLLTIAPFLRTPVFRQTVLFSGPSQKMLFPEIMVSGAEGIYLFVFGLILIYLYALFCGRKEFVWQYYLWILLLFFSLTHYHPQWFLWLTPFLIWLTVESNFVKLWPSLILVGCWLAITLLFEPSLSFGLFAPICPQLAKIGLGSLGTFGNFDAFQIKGLARSVFAAVSFWLIFFKK